MQDTDLVNSTLFSSKINVINAFLLLAVITSKELAAMRFTAQVRRHSSSCRVGIRVTVPYSHRTSDTNRIIRASARDKLPQAVRAPDRDGDPLLAVEQVGHRRCRRVAGKRHSAHELAGRLVVDEQFGRPDLGLNLVSVDSRLVPPSCPTSSSVFVRSK